MRADGWSRSLGHCSPGLATDSPCDCQSITASHQASVEQTCRGSVCVCVCVCVSGIDGLRFFPAQTIHGFRGQNADSLGKTLRLEPRLSVASVQTPGDPAGSRAG